MKPTPPCGKVCPKRTPDCHSHCKEWGEYEAARNANYAERNVARTVSNYFYDRDSKNARRLYWKNKGRNGRREK
jgi:hypothetical protein